jgi:hypothetical protein
LANSLSTKTYRDKYRQAILDSLLSRALVSAGGFVTAANTKVIFSKLIAKVSGYADAYRGYFIVLENSDISGVVEAQLGSGFSYADSALKNGFLTNYAGVEIYVTRDGTYVSATIGTKTVTNSGHRLFGVKKVATFAMPEGMKFEEKGVSGKTGMEVVTYGYIGAKAWATKSNLLVDVTIVAS